LTTLDSLLGHTGVRSGVC